MRNALPDGPGGHPRHGFTCESCGRLVITSIEGLYRNPARGTAQRFCTPACRQAAWRRRRAGAAEDAPRQYSGGRTRSLAPGRPDGPDGPCGDPGAAGPELRGDR